jgi:hypothetical protein
VTSEFSQGILLYCLKLLETLKSSRKVEEILSLHVVNNKKARDVIFKYQQHPNSYT